MWSLFTSNVLHGYAPVQFQLIQMYNNMHKLIILTLDEALEDLEDYYTTEDYDTTIHQQ